MTRAAFSGIAQDRAGNGLNGAQITFRAGAEADSPLASVYAAASGGSPLTQPISTDADGRLRVFVAGDATYRIEGLSEGGAGVDIWTAPNTEAGDAVIAARQTVQTFANLPSVTPQSVGVGDFVRVFEIGAVYQRAPDNATDAHLDYTGSGGIKLYLLPGFNGMYDARGIGAVADGRDNFNLHSYGMNTITGQVFWERFWRPSRAYAQGQQITNPVTHRFFRAVTAHTSGATFDLDAALWVEVVDPWHWNTGVLYTVGDAIHFPAQRRSYVCVSQHVAGASFEGDAANWEQGQFTGTDNVPAMLACVQHFHNRGLPVFWPAGLYRLSDFETYTGGSTSRVSVSNADKFIMHGVKGNTHFLIDEIEARMQPIGANSFVLDSGRVTETPRRQLRSEMQIHGIGWVGRWSHAPGGSQGDPNGSGICPTRFEGYQREDMTDCEFRSIRNKAMRHAHNKNVRHARHSGWYLARGMVRTVEASQVNISDMMVKYTADDAIDVNVTTNVGANSLGSMNISNINCFNTETAVICNYGTMITITNVTTFLGKGSAISVPRAGGQSPGSGRAPTYSVNISNINALNTIENFNKETGQINERPFFSGAILIAGNRLPSGGGFPGMYDPVQERFILPYEKPPGNTAPSYIHSPGGDGDVQQPPGANLIMDGLNISRSLPAVDRFSDWGFGPLFSMVGWRNPPVLDSSFKGSACAFVFDMRALTVSNFKFEGYDHAFVFNPTNSENVRYSFRDVTIKDGSCRDNKRGSILLRGFGDVQVNFDATIENVDFDVDPYHLSPARSESVFGGWQDLPFGAEGDLKAEAITLRTQARGWKVKNCTFRNCLRPINPGDNQGQLSNTIQEGNTVYGEIAGVGWNANNKGVGFVPALGGAWSYVIENATPDSATYGDIILTPRKEAATHPTAGFYPQGWRVRNTAPTGATPVSGWLRVTTGSSHVLGTDWIAQ